MSALCKSCGAPIRWVSSTTGKAMPLDAKPEKRIVVRRSVDTRNGEHYDVGDVVDTYVSHFVTCELANQHRRPRS